MERLEAALEKARESRKAALQGSEVAPTAREARPPEAAEIWHRLKQFKISNLGARKHRLVALNQGPASGNYDLLRSRTVHQMEENNWHSLAVTSPNSSCGKTTICLNLAFSLARQSDIRTLVMDLDFRRPAMHKLLGQRPSTSLHEILQGRERAEEHFLRFGENLAFALNSRAAPNSSELLQAKATHDRIRRITETFEPDFVIFDMPPMLATDDHVGFLPHVDCAMLVGGAESTTMAQLDNCEKELAGLTNVLGIVLNKCRFGDEDLGYTYEY